MGVHILTDNEEGVSCLYCSTSGWAFGPVFYSDEDPQEFLDWLGDEDPRRFKDQELENKVYEWRKSLEINEVKS